LKGLSGDEKVFLNSWKICEDFDGDMKKLKAHSIANTYSGKLNILWFLESLESLESIEMDSRQVQTVRKSSVCLQDSKTLR